ncbi:hypothetical protein MJO28_008239 [Puccinia striiformis f. sp. tritici]|uniref:Uncharacterized protein n=4 Tax=Puccinia striiformis TaxID=27350 RepID=A0A0L0V0C3_9BASI|nr:hypothetical protein MJO28_008239 [Puccinia striiformis f. sp. tritici]KAI9602592.1 hypothetical protein H4Q26_001882 [Puccinia striiformis f. sp. tritici PST-130]KNE92737.1 hypothetical protein PSTG_13868 [Puccinia striiformis f. sp. tritici PST-78]POW13369.1 hypothetical protein PSTT_03811 [Puccinia striiformis]KAI7952520.1 hypothetical protein MJO29_008151 [Puccinia striiformis f. sp. tritici]
MSSNKYQGSANGLESEVLMAPGGAELLAPDHVVDEAIKTGSDCKLTSSHNFSGNPLSASLSYLLGKTLHDDVGCGDSLAHIHIRRLWGNSAKETPRNHVGKFPENP